MKTRLIQAVLVGLWLTGPGLAQVASVKCCISEGNLTRIGECLSGPNDTNAPLACGSIGTCVLGFGEHPLSIRDLCDPAQPAIPDEPRAVCISWVATGASVAQECVAAPNTDFTLFQMYDADHDGDLDLRDIAVFQRTYESVPKEVQSEARLVFVECCEPDLGMLDSQPDVSDGEVAEDATKDATEPFCTLGFSGIVEPGDYLHQLCRPGSTGHPDAGDSTCVSWSASEVPVAYFCEAADVSDYQCPTGEDGRTGAKGCLADLPEKPTRK